MIRLAKRCPYCAHKVDQTTGKCINDKCIGYGQVVVKLGPDKEANNK